MQQAENYNQYLGQFQGKARAEELSEGRTDTRSHYESTWGKWDSWCNQRSFDSFRCDVNPILEYLTEIFHQGLEYSPICGKTSAISAYYYPIRPFLVGKHSQVKKLTIGISDNRMPQPKFSFIGNVEKVHNLLGSQKS